MPPIDNNLPNHVFSYSSLSVTPSGFGDQNSDSHSTMSRPGNFHEHSVTGETVPLPAVKSLITEVDLKFGRPAPVINRSTTYLTETQALPLEKTPFRDLPTTYVPNATSAPVTTNFPTPLPEANLLTRHQITRAIPTRRWYRHDTPPQHGENNGQCRPANPGTNGTPVKCGKVYKTIASADTDLIDRYSAWLQIKYGFCKSPNSIIMFAEYLHRYHATSLSAYPIPEDPISIHSDAKIENFLLAPYPEFKRQAHRQELPEALTRFREFRKDSAEPIWVNHFSSSMPSNAALHVRGSSSNHSLSMPYEISSALGQNRPEYNLLPSPTKPHHQRLNPQSSVTLDMTSLQTRQVAQSDVAELNGFSNWLNKKFPKRDIPIAKLGVERAVHAYAEYLARYHGETLAQQVFPQDQSFTESFDPRIENFRMAGYPEIGANESEYIVQGLNMLAQYRKESR